MNTQVNNAMTHAPFLERIQAAIENEKAHAASDASLEEGRLEGYSLLTKNRKSEIVENTMHYKSWKNKTIKGTKAIV